MGYNKITMIRKIIFIVFLCFIVGIETEKHHKPFAYWQVGDSARMYLYATETAESIPVGCGWPFIEIVNWSDRDWACGRFPPRAGFGYVKTIRGGCFMRTDLASREVDPIYLCGSRGDL